MDRRSLLAALLASAATPLLAGVPPALMLANVYRPGLPLADYWVSEKMDGVRGYWDGRALWTRGGEKVHAPAWFTKDWPAVPLDGELWAGRGQFAKAASTVRQQVPNEQAWRGLRFMVFDLPGHGGPFNERLAVLNGLLSKLDSPYARPVAQSRVASHEALMKLLQSTVHAGGEGLMLHRGGSLYKAERNDDLLKLKLHEDADARVVGHLPGQGKYAGMLGALLVETPDGRRFRIGSGLSDAQRRHPPAVGTWISYRLRGTHDSGLPRFATFLRERPDLGP
ncbi:DNA ligase [Xylophilus sp. ASV27]|uniref:DNA ligase n=1 Tax=Xylophilus sp. ASV27 TaxID=2795129 RepID=UPI0018EC5C09|nr:DNA ligase [Xylophilus sp. ASV27]